MKQAELLFEYLGLVLYISNDLFPFEIKNPLIMLSAKTLFLQYIISYEVTCIVQTTLPGSEHVYIM